MTDHTTSPKSVVVPVEPTEAMIEAAFDAFEIDRPKQYRDGNEARLAIWSAMLAAAPAPSSLAGGEAESRALDWMEWVAQGALDTDDVQLSGAEIIQHAEIELASIRKQAVLSPEAPARDGVADALIWTQRGADVDGDPLRVTTSLGDMTAEALLSRGTGLWNVRGSHIDGRIGIATQTEARDYAEVALRVRAKERTASATACLAALTPRHEAPAFVPTPERYYPYDHEAPASTFTISRAEYETLKAGYPGDPSLLHEAPAEGAGEAMTEREVRQWIEACNHEPARQVLRDYLALRARSSAPEAREEALGNLLAVIHGDGGHRALEVGTKQAALEAEKIVAGLFAAPSADKLREVVEGFVSDLTGSLKNRSTMLTINHNALTARIDQALAALKAEGA